MHLVVDHEEYDFCHEHAQELIEFLKYQPPIEEFQKRLNGEKVPLPPKRRGRPHKNLGISPE